MAIDPRHIELIDDRTAEILRVLTPAQKWEFANRMVVQGRDMVRSLIRSQHPAWTDARIDAETRKRMTDGAS